MKDLIRATSLQSAPELIEELGGNPDDVFGRFGLNPSISESRTEFIPFSTLTAMLGLCEHTLGTPEFGLRLAARQGAGILGPLAVAIRHSETIGLALRYNVDFLQTYSPAFGTELVVGPTHASYLFNVVVRDVTSLDHLVELGLAVALNKFRMIAGQGFMPTELTFRHARRFPESVYVHYLGCPVRFDAAENAVRFPAELLSRRVAQADRSAGELALDVVRTIAHAPTFVDAVTARIARTLSAGGANLDTVATALHMHPRTVQRRLAAAGHTFAGLVDDERRNAAMTLLTNPDLSMGEIAERLGYTQQSAFTRSCYRWFSSSPSAERARLRSLIR